MWLADPLSPSGPIVLHLLRPQRSGAVGGLDLHVLELAAAQTESGMCRSIVVALGATAAFRRRARSVGITVEDTLAWRTHRLLTRHGPDLVHAHGYQADVVASVPPGRPRQPVVMTWHGATAPGPWHRARWARSGGSTS